MDSFHFSKIEGYLNNVVARSEKSIVLSEVKLGEQGTQLVSDFIV